MKNNLKLISLAIVFMFVALTVSAQSQKIAYVDSEQIIPNMPEYKAYLSEFEQYQNILKKQIEGEQAKAQQYLSDVSAKMQRGELSPAQQKMEQDKLQKLDEELQRKVMKMEEDKIVKQQELIKPVEDKFYEALKTVSKSNNITYVFEKKSFIYYDGGEDITSKVKAQLGIQ